MVARNMQYLLNTLRGHQVSLPASLWAALAFPCQIGGVLGVLHLLLMPDAMLRLFSCLCWL